MTTTADALAAASDAMSRIDHALAVQDATAYGDASWLPGDPLHRRPRGSLFGEQTVRQMFEIVDNEAWHTGRCVPCQVSWHGDDPCWVCGTDRPRPGSRPVVAAGMAALFPATVRAGAQRMVADGEISMADLDELQRFRVFLGDMVNHCPECLEPITDEHGPGSHDETLTAARMKWPDLDDEQLRERCLLGWQTYARGRVSLNAIAGLRR